MLEKHIVSKQYIRGRERERNNIYRLIKEMHIKKGGRAKSLCSYCKNIVFK